MRLRYLHLRNYPPISDIKVCFSSGSPLARDCAIRFVVGVNGSGKSNLLRAVAEVFLALADGRRTPFPVQMIYELGHRDTASFRTLVLDWSKGRDSAAMWIGEPYVFPDDATVEQFEQAMICFAAESSEIPVQFRPLIRQGEWPSGSVTPQPVALPSAVLAYTTGDLRPWRSVWSRNQDAQGLLEASDDALSDERPAGWTNAQEAMLESAQQETRGATNSGHGVMATVADSYRRPILLDATLLKCALLAVALPQAFIETANYPERAEVDAAMAKLRQHDDNKNVLQELLERGGWHHLVSVGFRSRLQAAEWDRKLCETAHDWWLCAGEVVAEPHPQEARRTVIFDLKGGFSPMGLSFRSAASDDLATCTTQGEALWTLLGGAKDATRFELFTRLLELHQSSLFDDVLLRLRRQPEPGAASDARRQDIGVLRYEELSDGEQMFLGRMALLHLLQGQQESLLLLDEPETHFNDLWKRDVVSIVDDALADTSAEVLIATHAALMLTDALKDELVVLGRDGPNVSKSQTETNVRFLGRDIHTFGATGDHPLRDIFGAPDTVGRRASRLLEVLIAAASLAEEIDAVWLQNEMPSPELVTKVLELASETETGLTVPSVGNYLRSIEAFALHFGADKPLQMKAVLETFICQTGPGYFQVELKRAWRRLQEGAPRVA